MKKNIENIKQILLSKLIEIVLEKTGDYTIVKSNENKEITTNPIYDLNIFKFKPGQYALFVLGTPTLPKKTIGLTVGIGKGCVHEEEREELWFLLEGEEGISHFCGMRKEDFEKNGVKVI